MKKPNPDLLKSKITPVRIPADLLAKLKARAAKEGRTLSNLIIFLLTRSV